VRRRDPALAQLEQHRREERLDQRVELVPHQGPRLDLAGPALADSES